MSILCCSCSSAILNTAFLNLVNVDLPLLVLKDLLPEKGENTEVLEQAIQHCKAFDNGIHQTAEIIELIQSMSLFKQTQLTITTKDGSEKKTSPFKIIDIDLKRIPEN